MDEKPTQRTSKGYEIPVPTHAEVDTVLSRSAQPLPTPKRSRRRRQSKDT